ncbi:MAG: MgtC/SapB family protein [Polyangiaceae bacterium]|nr:MgtC/SapB family protein [Polyangiaceae bacterium]
MQQTLVEIAESAVKLGAAVLVGSLIGLNRGMHHKATGLRTLGLVSLATCLVTMASVGFAKTITDMNPVSRVVQGALTGIGFIGAGAIVRDRETGSTSGLTTAASVWMTAALGIVCGLGAWLMVLIASIFALLLLVVGGGIEGYFRKRVDTREDTGGHPPRD